MSSKKVVFSNLIWRLMERVGAQTVTLIVSIILARLLDPEIYGTIAIVTVFITILQVFIDSGLGNALIQKKDADDLDFSSVFYFNILVCTVLYFGMFFAAPFIAAFYDKPELTSIIRVLCLMLIISGVKNVQQAYVSRKMIFKKFFFATLGGTLGAAAIGIIMAYRGFGVWALVAQALFNTFVDTVILWITVRWRPKPLFSIERLKTLFSFGWKLLVSSLVDVVYRELRQLVIGKLYSSEDLAFYNRGTQFPKLITTNIDNAIDSVLLPAMSSEQDNRDLVRIMTRRAVKTSTFLLMPLMVGLAVCAQPIVRLVLTEKWLPAVFFLRIFCVTYAFYPIHTANLNAIKALGRSDLFLKLEIIKKVVGLIALVSTMFISVEAMAVSLLVTSVLSQIINSWPNKKLLNYSYLDQVKDMLPQILLSAFMGVIVYCVSFIGLSDVFTLLIQVPLGIMIYVGGSYLLHIDSFDYVVGIAKSYFYKKKRDQAMKGVADENCCNEKKEE